MALTSSTSLTIEVPLNVVQSANLTLYANEVCGSQHAADVCREIKKANGKQHSMSSGSSSKLIHCRSRKKVATPALHLSPPHLGCFRAAICRMPSPHCAGPAAQAHEGEGVASDTGEHNRNRLRIPVDALSSIASTWDGSPSRLPLDILNDLADLPMTSDVRDYRSRAAALQAWKHALQRGHFPDERLDFPAQPFKTKLTAVLGQLEIPRFTRRFPKLTDAVLRQMMMLTHAYEAQLLAAQEEAAKQRDKKPEQQPSPSEDQEGQEDTMDAGMEGGEAGDPSSKAGQSDNVMDAQEQLESGQQGGEGAPELEVSLERAEVSGEGDAAGEGGDGGKDDAAAAAAEAIAEELAEQFKEEMAPLVERLDAAMQHFGDLNDLLGGSKGWDLSEGVWKTAGWADFQDLRRRLERLRELRDLVRSLGRGGGKGPLRRAPEEVPATRAPPGVIRSDLVPEEVMGLSKSGSLTQMLPAEAALLAMGWPRQHEESDGEGVEARGSHPARLLFMARLAEQSLLSYRRAGWLEGEPARMTRRRELRPAAEQGPIIVCLDTSGSMMGAREIVAKAVVLECMRGAHFQGRACLVYAFSGPGDVQTLELRLGSEGLQQLLTFLSCSFHGGTDVDAPLALSLKRLQQEEWEAADILMVTDGEIRPPSAHIVRSIEEMKEKLGLKVHGLLVGSDVTSAMEELCTDVHLFKSWSAVGRSMVAR